MQHVCFQNNTASALSLQLTELERSEKKCKDTKQERQQDTGESHQYRACNHTGGQMWTLIEMTALVNAKRGSMRLHFLKPEILPDERTKL